jgi:murein DD-endopeptidase MepM/ murein hydrolase activator NlpD
VTLLQWASRPGSLPRQWREHSPLLHRASATRRAKLPGVCSSVRLAALTTLPFLMLSYHPGFAAEIRFGLPVACEIGRDCFIQNYFDHDPGPDRRDYACGELSYDGHSGTDFRVADVPAMSRGVTVVAAASGTVKAVRDGMPDVKVDEAGRIAIKGREAGNGVVIDHGGGWETQYSHLRLHSVLVRPGERVEAGAPLGLIGMSGLAEFPHVELAVRHDAKTYDPFIGSGDPSACGGTSQALWAPEVLAQLKYLPTGGLVSGFAREPPKSDLARQGAYDSEILENPPALVYWADVFGAQTGDEQVIRIKDPDGAVFAETSNRLNESKVSWFAYSGRKRPPDGWKPGAYRGFYSLVRDGQEVARLEKLIEIR